ncbi:putative membrane protein [Leptospira fainei serovar Hurstbridge str. BUT 6]|uniref:Membrane protein n=1 Tax=Leptospira fainei serovar Hurstbridge str. BUT 6 TaxID=1193011 RepID=S3V6W3_9LEPT|nr:histidine kinase N-terminal 7TM domain-containing protein [Leptospira fainei]EPG76399.1 putative membrane protein [Leptospira fainei serovar Hurstbridge str. BUT 6]
MALLTFILLFSSAVIFYKYSNKNTLSNAFTLLSLCLAFWSLFLFLCDIHFPLWIRIPIIDLITFFPLPIPILVTYVTHNYTRPNDLSSPPRVAILVHTLLLAFFIWFSWEGKVTPFKLENGEVVYKGSFYYYLYCGYLYGSIFISLALIIRNIFDDEYFVRLHSIYMFAGIAIGLFISTVLTVVLPLLGISLNSISVIGLLIFLWLTWIPIAHYRLFNIALVDFKQDFRNPKISSAILSVNRYLLNKLNPVKYKEICDQFENIQREEVYALQAEMLLEATFSKEGGVSNLVRKYAKKVTDLFIGPK